MEELFSFLKLLKDHLWIYYAFKKLLKEAPELKNMLRGKRTFYDISEIRDEFQRGSLNIGDLVTCEGFLSNYSQTFKPLTFRSIISGSLKEKRQFKMVDGKVIPVPQKIILEADYIPFQMPISNIPSLFTPSGLIKCCFLYPLNFDSFVFSRSQKKASESYDKDVLEIPDSSKPIVVILDASKYGSFLDKKVEIRGQLQEAPRDIIDLLDHLYDPTVREILMNSYFPFEERTSFICLSTFHPESQINLIDEKLESLKGVLFTEYHAENIRNIEIFQTIVGKAVPFLSDDYSFGLTLPGTKVFDYPNRSEVKFLFREPNIFGFYIQVNLFNPAEFNTKLALFRDFIKKFSRELKEQSRKEMGAAVELKMDFVFDYSKKYLLDPRGALNSEEIEKIAQADKDIKETVEWLRKS